MCSRNHKHDYFESLVRGDTTVALFKSHSAALIKCCDQNHLRGGKGLFLLSILDHSPPLRKGKTGTQGSNLEASLLAIPHSMTSSQGAHFTAREGTAGTVENVDCWLLGGVMLNWLSYTGQIQEPRDCNSCSGLGPPTPIQNQYNSPPT